MRTLDPPGRNPLAWSPDGRWLTYFTPFVPEGFLLMIVDTRTWVPRKLADLSPGPCHPAYGPFWSTTSRYLRYNAVGCTDSSYLVSLDADDKVPVPRSVWSPDGTNLLGAVDGELIVYNVAHGAARSIAPGVLGIAASKSWSPDGTMIVNGSAVITLDNERMMTFDKYEWMVVGWSADGAFIAVDRTNGLSPQDPCYGVAIHHVQTGERKTCLNTNASASWSPTQPLIAFARARGSRSPTSANTYDYFLLDVRSGVQRLLLESAIGSRTPGGIVWSPDGRYVVIGAVLPYEMDY